MDSRYLTRDAFCVYGCATETTAAQNDSDLAALYAGFFGGGLDARCKTLAGRRGGYYGLSWYTKGRERYAYLLGVEADAGNAVPENAVKRQVPSAAYLTARFPRGAGIIEAWTEFFYTEIPRAGYAVNGAVNLYFEYYPETVTGDFELWVPVVAAK